MGGPSPFKEILKYDGIVSFLSRYTSPNDLKKLLQAEKTKSESWATCTNKNSMKSRSCKNSCSLLLKDEQHEKMYSGEITNILVFENILQLH